MEEEGPEPGPSNWRSRGVSRNNIEINSRRTSNLPHTRNHVPLLQGFTFNRGHNDRGRRIRENNGSTQRLNHNLPHQYTRNNTKQCERGGFQRSMSSGEGKNRGPRQGSESFKFIGFRTLEEIARADSKQVLQEINKKKPAFMTLVDSQIDRHDVFVLLIEILSKITLTPFVELKSKLILEVCNSNFITHLKNYLMDLPYVENKSANNLYWKDPTEFWKNFITFCGDIVETSPSTAFRKCRALIESVTKSCLDGLKQYQGFTLAEEYVLKLTEVRDKVTSFSDNYALEGKRRRVEQDIQPPENFRMLNVVPNRDDLMGSQPFLRPNIVEGGYTDVEHYLDVQFRLLREDCFGPLREGINQYLGDSHKRKYDHVRIYHNVKFICPYVANLKVGAVVQIDMKSTKHFQKINWAHNKRFLFGSLVLFTKDNCKTFIAATIVDRDVNLLLTGKLPVSLIDTVDNSIYNEDSYTMIESEVYFEPYFHVLKALQNPSFPNHLAMQQYIVKVDPASKHPAYLTADTEYVLRDNNVKMEEHEEFLELNDIFAKVLDEDDGKEKASGTDITTNIKFKVVEPETWPPKEELKFNESQYEAYRLALTHEFAVIQGPPGTGKTYVGIKVAKTLLQNIKSSKDCLMLVICYTNHALDQFLEAISEITKSIVRIGGQSRSNAMEQFNLTNLRRKALSPSIMESHKFFIDQKINLRDSIENLEKRLALFDILNNGVASYTYLEEKLPVLSLLNTYYKSTDIFIEDPLQYWLFEGIRQYHTSFETCLLEYECLTNNEDVDKNRIQMILDDDKVSQEQQTKLECYKKENASFSLTDAKLKIQRLISFYKKSRDDNEKQNLQLIIQDLNSRINLFNDMVQYRNHEVRHYFTSKTNFSAISMENRWSLYFMWVKHVIDDVKEEVVHLQASISPIAAAYDEARMMMDEQLLKNNRVKVVGMTTSGAARMRKLLQAIAPKIVIVEEAAEVLEQHIITSLTQDCQHLILIGDHQQLRPSASHVKLAKHYNIEVSLFERMITNGIHSRRLNVQHRMRPEIAALISPHIYPNLENHPSVERFANVLGVEKNLYFFTHDFEEEVSHDSSSKANHKEADMTLALANYLMQQGYTANDITILAAYSGQMFYMRKERQNYASLSHVKITVVDNFQGEESNIILLSLVRNNSDKRIGFLGTENRICVALSRAKQGFYIFGNIEMLKEKSELWRKIAATLENNGSLGRKLTLKCQNHPEQITTISSPEDFTKLPPEGGCFEKCNYQYYCGHHCQLYCHGYDLKHIKTKCTMMCERILCDLEHVCPLKCQDVCRPCEVYVLKTLPCGHEMNVHCHRKPNDPVIKCLTKIDVTLPSCGHKAQKHCYMDITAVKCPELCMYRLEECGHVCSRKCHVHDDPDHKKYTCLKPCARAKAGCTADLTGDRGDHQCRKNCNEKCDDCHVQVKKRRSTCKHVERTACCTKIDEIPCTKKCARTITSCGHFCQKKCFEKCGDCKQMIIKIVPECNHKVKIECMQAVTRELCKERCTRQLRCGHPCKGLCGEACDESLCKILTKEVKAPCGHNVKLPCNLVSAFDKGDVEPDQLLKYCKAPCMEVLACKHVCGGTCAQCWQGRLHTPCKQKCNQDNICGHQCQESCNQICPPCNKICEVKCPHSYCKKLCCEPCIPCQEKCSRSCVHGTCTRRCGEQCDRAPCSERCPLPLSCGHACRGLCGEPCPPLCRICRPEEFPKDDLGYDYEDSDKFLLLQDCGHVFEIDYIDQYMTVGQEIIKIRTCPLCRQNIINTNRYKDAVNNMFKNEINPIKERVYGTHTQIIAKRQELHTKVSTFMSKYKESLKDYKDMRTTFLNFFKMAKSQKKNSVLDLEMQCIYLNVFEMIVECWQQFREQASDTLLDELKKYIKVLLDVLKINDKGIITIKISEQQQKDMGNEIKRLNKIVQFSKLLDHAKHLKDDPLVKKYIETAKETVFMLSIFNEEKALESLQALKKCIKSSGTISQYERASIVTAINLKAGHWYKCPNGHVYCIGECGGAMEVGKCADCGASIGGQHHALLRDNAHAPEMDGSSFPAWSEQNNMANFNLDNIL